MNRKHHLFQFKASEIAKAASAEAEYHEERAEWWDAEFNKAVEKAQAAGLRVEKFQVTGGEQARMVIDPTLQDRITTCERKRIQHQRDAETLKIEAATYETQLGRTYDLDSEDIQHFRLAGGAREE